MSNFRRVSLSITPASRRPLAVSWTEASRGLRYVPCLVVLVFLMADNLDQCSECDCLGQGPIVVSQNLRCEFLKPRRPVRVCGYRTTNLNCRLCSRAGRSEQRLRPAARYWLQLRKPTDEQLRTRYTVDGIDRRSHRRLVSFSKNVTLVRPPIRVLLTAIMSVVGRDIRVQRVAGVER